MVRFQLHLDPFSPSSPEKQTTKNNNIQTLSGKTFWIRACVLKCMFMLFNILLYSQINISLWTNFIFTVHLSVWLLNYRSFYSHLGAAILQLLAHINLS